jgi:hypothetical protein
MTPAITPQLLEHLNVTPAQPHRALPVTMRATMATRDGRYITGGVLDLAVDGQCWGGRMRDLERGGIVATMYFSEGVREVVVRLEDGRRSFARITGTRFVGSSQRVCDLEGISPLL